MKIEKVEGQYTDVLGLDAEIHLNKEGIFSIKSSTPLPDDYRYDTLPTSTSLAEIRTLIKEFCVTCIRTKFVKKVLFLRISSTEDVLPYDQTERQNKMFESNGWDMHKGGTGISIAYIVANVYTHKYKTRVGSEKPYIKNNTVTHDPIYGWKESELYELVESNVSGIRSGILPKRDILFAFDPTHTMDYEEGMMEFIKRTTVAMGEMVKKVTDFFNVAPTELHLKARHTNNILQIQSPTNE